MTDATVSTASAAPTVVVDIEATVKAEVAKLLAEAKAEESKIVTWVKTTVATYWPHVAAAAAGYAASAYDVVKLVGKFL
jgi:hypothetical protein